MPPRHSRKHTVNRAAKLKGAKNEMQKFRDTLNANPWRKGPKLPRVR